MNIEKTLVQATVIIPRRADEALFAMKVRKIGAGCWNGYGGGIDEGETVLQAAVRELFEESNDKNGTGGVIALQNDLEKVAIVDFHNTKSDGSTFVCRVHFFFVYTWKGEFKDSEEMVRPTWFPIDNLPFGEMMLADRDYMPKLFQGKKIRVKAYYGPFQKTLLQPTEIVEVAESFGDLFCCGLKG